MSRLLFRGVRAISRIALSGLRSDPAHFTLMVSRRVSSSSAFLKMTRRLDAILRVKLISRFKVASRVRSSIFVLQGEPKLALARLRNDISPEGYIARSRALAFLGEYEMALDCALKAGKRGKHLLSVYSSEIEMLNSEFECPKSDRTVKSKPRTVLHLLTNSLPFTNSGYTQRTHSVLQSLQVQGWNVIAYTRVGYPWLVGQVTRTDRDVVDTVEYRRLLPPSLAETSVARSGQQIAGLTAAAIEERPSILHTTTEFVNGVSVLAVSNELNIPWVYEVRGQLADTWLSASPDRQTTSFKYQRFTAQEASIARRANAVITLGSEMKKELIARGIEASKILVCPNAVGEEFTQEVPDRGQCRRELNLENDYLYIGTVSSLVGYEGLENLIKSFAELVPEYPKLRLLIVGDGAERPKLMDLANQLQITERTIFPGRVDRAVARKYHRALDIFVVPRLDLPVTRSVTPLKPVEALAFEVPVVASDLPALREIVTEDVDGLFFKSEDPSDLADKLRILLDDEIARERMGRAGREKVLRTRTWSSNAEKISDLYESLLKGI